METERLYIRPFRPDDDVELHEIFGDLKVMERIPSGPSKSLAETQRRLAKIMEHQTKHGFSLWALIRKEDGKLIGDCGLILVEGCGPEVEISYDIAYEFWGRGYATEAAGECLRYGLEDLGLKRIVGLTYADHHASRRIMEKIGMAYEGKVRHYNRDLVQYYATRKEGPHNSEEL